MLVTQAWWDDVMEQAMTKPARTITSGARALGPKPWLRVTQMAQEPLRGAGISDYVRDDVMGASEGWVMLTQVD